MDTDTYSVLAQYLSDMVTYSITSTYFPMTCLFVIQSDIATIGIRKLQDPAG